MKQGFKSIIGNFILTNDRIFPTDEEVKQAEKIQPYLALLKDPKYFADFYVKNLELTKKQIKDKSEKDSLIIQTMSSIGELAKVTNLLSKRVREWYGFYFPEFQVNDNEKFIELIFENSKKDLLSSSKIENKMGMELSKEDIDQIIAVAKTINSLYQLKRSQEIYLESLMKKMCPNMLEIAGASIGANLIAHAGSLKRLMELPASTVQLLGAEKALFRHLKNKKVPPPKYGIIHEHKYISQARKKNHGKIARALADKISIAVRVDYFKGNFVGDKLREELEKRIAKINSQKEKINPDDINPHKKIADKMDYKQQKYNNLKPSGYVPKRYNSTNNNGSNNNSTNNNNLRNYSNNNSSPKGFVPKKNNWSRDRK